MKTQMQSTFFNFTLASLLIVMALSTLVGCSSAVDAPPKADVGTVSLVIDFPEGSQQTDLDLSVGCSADSTVFEVLQRAEKAGDLKCRPQLQRVARICFDLPQRNQRQWLKLTAKSWTFYVNDELGKESCGTCSVKPDDKIRWVYGQPPAELE